MRASVVVIVVAASVTTAAAAERLKLLQPERDAFRAEVGRLVDGGGYEAVESQYRALVKDDPRFTGGISKLVDFYAALGLPSAEVGTPAFEARRASHEAWLRHSPRLHLPKMGLARLASSEGWKLRGGGYADKVPAEAWPDVERHWARSWAWAQKALADQPADSEFYSEMIDLCREIGCPRAEAERFLQIGSRINVRYEGVYVAMATYLLPRWHGSPEDVARFAKQSADSNPGLGDVVYARIATVALLIEGKDFPTKMPGFEWSRIRSGLMEIDRQYPDAARTQHLLARFAFAYRDKATAKVALLRLGAWDPVEGPGYWWTARNFASAQKWALSVP